MDRAVRGVEAFGIEGPLARWRELRRRIHQDVRRNGYDPALGSFVRAYGSRELDTKQQFAGCPTDGGCAPH